MRNRGTQRSIGDRRNKGQMKQTTDHKNTKNPEKVTSKEDHR